MELSQFQHRKVFISAINLINMNYNIVMEDGEPTEGDTPSEQPTEGGEGTESN